MIEPSLNRVTAYICDLCLDGQGGECHVPGCLLWMSTAPDIPIRDKTEPAFGCTCPAGGWRGSCPEHGIPA